MHQLLKHFCTLQAASTQLELCLFGLAGGHDKVKIKCKIGVPDSVSHACLSLLQYPDIVCTQCNIA